MKLENYTQHHSVESFLEAAHRVLTDTAEGLTDPFQVVIVAGPPGSGKSHLVKQATEKRPEVIYFEPRQKVPNELSDIELFPGGTIVFDEVTGFDQDMVARALTEIARSARERENQSLVVLVVQAREDIARWTELLPKKVVLIEVNYPQKLTLAVRSRESAVGGWAGDKLTHLAIVGEGAQQMFTALTG